MAQNVDETENDVYDLLCFVFFNLSLQSEHRIKDSYKSCSMLI